MTGVQTCALPISYTLSVLNNNSGCAGTGTITVTVNPLPQANAGADQSVLQGGTATIGGSPAASGGTPSYTYSWTPGTNLSATNIANPVATVNANTSYTLIVTDSKGCTALDDITISVIAVTSYASSYANLYKQLNGAYYQVGTDHKLYFKYTNEYSKINNQLNYRIYNTSHSPVTGLPSLNKTYGDNFYNIDLTSLSLSAGEIYVLEVISDKNDKFYLKFKAQ